MVIGQELSLHGFFIDDVEYVDIFGKQLNLTFQNTMPSHFRLAQHWEPNTWLWMNCDYLWLDSVGVTQCYQIENTSAQWIGGLRDSIALTMMQTCVILSSRRHHDHHHDHASLNQSDLGGLKRCSMSSGQERKMMPDDDEWLATTVNNCELLVCANSC